VNPGEYELRVSGACSFTPSEARKDVYMNVVQDFTAGSGCMTASRPNATASGSVFTLRDGDIVLGDTDVHIEERLGPADALARLQDITREQPTPSRSLTIAGYPAVERQAVITLPGPADADLAGSKGPLNITFTAVTAAIAVDSTVVRYETQLPPDVAPATVRRFFQLDRNFTTDALPELHGAAQPGVPVIRNPVGSRPTDPGSVFSTPFGPGIFGELEIAASDTVTAIVYGTANGPFFSSDGGQTVQASAYNTVAAPTAPAFVSLGDPTVAIGAPNSSSAQTFYFAQPEQAVPPAQPGGLPTTAVGLYQSPDNGQTFNFTSFPIDCTNAVLGCVATDQPHLAADRVFRAVQGQTNLDQLYLVAREEFLTH
jgi:hypothetical protein